MVTPTSTEEGGTASPGTRVEVLELSPDQIVEPTRKATVFLSGGGAVKGEIRNAEVVQE